MLNGVLLAWVRAVMMRLELKRWLVLLLLAAAMGVQAAPSVDERLAAIEDGKVSERAVIDAEIAAIARQLPRTRHCGGVCNVSSAGTRTPQISTQH